MAIGLNLSLIREVIIGQIGRDLIVVVDVDVNIQRKELIR
jgi:hypothetical protein